MNLLFEKKAELGNQIMIFPFLFILILIAGGIAIGVLIYYNTEYDSRQAEADILNYQIEKCIYKSADYNKISENFYQLCELDKNLLENNGYFVKICNELSAEACVSSDKPVIQIGSNFQSCFFKGAAQNKNYPKCRISEIFKDAKKVSIIVGSNQKIKKVNG